MRIFGAEISSGSLKRRMTSPVSFLSMQRREAAGPAALADEQDGTRGAAQQLEPCRAESVPPPGLRQPKDEQRGAGGRPGEGEEFLAAESSGGNDGDAGWFGLIFDEFAPGLTDYFIDQGRAATDGGRTVAGAFEGETQVGYFLLIRVPHAREG